LNYLLFTEKHLLNERRITAYSGKLKTVEIPKTGQEKLYIKWRVSNFSSLSSAISSISANAGTGWGPHPWRAGGRQALAAAL